MSRLDAQPAVSDLRLERYRLGELPPDELQAIEGQLAADPELRQRLSALDQE